ncbi:MFS transporter [aff. Roholtiella sp. LEGE 12411]|uniref:MFS transporter n=1 Tax=aff. Roholtiella sp. LEGE 12411 TaxID=1828822 RepID=UPI00187F5765|nr:MFS transporter [aff. Roholtiella sp. LEGE 12411]MBE9036157.1 MFS transporter [aff. Roholtiella sp. LEGE 12411]
MQLQKKFFQTIPRTVWVLGFVSLLTDISSEMIHSVLPLFLVSVLGANILTVGIIEGIAEATASVLKVFSGALSDYLGHRKGLAVFGYGLSTFVKPLFAVASTPTGVLIARFGDRIGKGIRVAPRDALVADSTNPEVRGAAYGLRQSLDTIGAFLGPLVAFALMATSTNNFRLVFWLALIPGFLAVALLTVGVREPRTSRTQQRRSNPLQWQALRSLGQRYWVLVAVALLFNFGNSSDAFLLLRAEQTGISAPLIPLTLVVMNIAYSFSAYPLGILSDRLGRFGLLVGGFLLYALVYLGFAFVQAPWQVWGLFALYGLHLGMSQGLLLALVANSIPANLRGTAFGFLNLAVGLALLPASLLAGGLWQTLGAEATFIAGSFFAIAAVLLLVTQRNKYKY